MKNICRLFVPIAVLFLLTPSSVVAGGGGNEQAVRIASEWLKLIDGGKYSESWEAAAEFFKDAVFEEQWVAALERLRKPLGTVISRRVKSSEYRTELPGAPDGEYVVVEFVTSFENKKSAIEAVTPMKEKDGTWKVSGYYIK